VTWSGVLPRARKNGQSIRPYPSTVRREPERFPFPDDWPGVVRSS
jgi:hypothetical protein